MSILSPKELGCDDVTWNLSELFSGVDDPKIKQVLSTANEEVSAFKLQYKNLVHSLDAVALKDTFIAREKIVSPIYKLRQYSHLLLTLDTQNDEVKSLVSMVDEACSRMSNEMLFFDLELGAVSDAQFSKMMDPDILGPYTYVVQQIHDKARYKLSEKEEQMVNLKDLTGVRAARKLYGELTSSFEFEFDIDGETKTMNGSELRNLRLHPDKDVRQRAMTLFFSRYKENSIQFTHLYNTIVKDFNIERKLRGYETPISVMNVGNDLENEAVETLHEVTTNANDLVARYYRLKGQLCNIPDMTLSDIYAPLPETNRVYKWREAKDLVLDSFKSFDETFYTCAKEMFDQDRIDAPVAPRKRGGAFCSSSTPDIKPYVMLNFLGKPRDVSTIAHELGHAIHAMLSDGQPLTNYHSILPMCETASVFAEMVLMDYMKQVETDKSARIALLADKLEDLFATSHRQNMFSRFEIQSHDSITKGLMSSDDLCSLYHKELKGMFGDSVRIPEEYHWEWSTIPHIYDVPFYVHSYNFGNLLVLALYEQYLEEGDDFVPRLKQLLSKGSSASPKDLTQDINVDITDPVFWQKSLHYIESMIDELEMLMQDS